MFYLLLNLNTSPNSSLSKFKTYKLKIVVVGKSTCCVYNPLTLIDPKYITKYKTYLFGLELAPDFGLLKLFNDN